MNLVAIIKILNSFCKLAHHVNTKSPLLVGVTHYITSDIREKLSALDISSDKKEALINLFEIAFRSHDQLYGIIKVITDPDLVMRLTIKRFEVNADTCLRTLKNLVSFLKTEVFQEDPETIRIIDIYNKEFEQSTQIAFDLFYKTIYVGKPMAGDSVVDLTLGFHSKLHGFLSRLLNMVIKKYSGEVLDKEYSPGFFSKLKELIK